MRGKAARIWSSCHAVPATAALAVGTTATCASTVTRPLTAAAVTEAEQCQAEAGDLFTCGMNTYGQLGAEPWQLLVRQVRGAPFRPSSHPQNTFSITDKNAKIYR